MQTEKEFQQQQIDLEKKYSGKTVIANFFQLGQEGKSFSRELKKLKRSDAPVEIAHVIATNSQWANCGKLYEVDEDKTAEFQEKLAAHKEILEKREKIQKIGADKLATAITSMVEDEDDPTEGFKKRNALCGVNLDNELVENVGPDQGQVSPDDCVFTGTKKECEKFIKKNKVK